MTKIRKTLVIVAAVFLTVNTTAMLAQAKGFHEEYGTQKRNSGNTSNTILQTYACDYSCRLRRRVRARFIAAKARKEDLLPLSSSGVSLEQSAEPGTTGILDPTVSSGAKAIWIYLEAQEASLTESGTVVKTYRISSGASATPTPKGEFKIHGKQELRVSGQAVPYRMPNYMAFTKNSAFGLHGLPYLGNSAASSAYWSEALSHIGIPVSHGCVRFLPEEASEIYAWADIGIPVFIQQ